MKFFKSVGQEMKIVSWPNAKQTRKDATTVVMTSVLFAIFFGVVDFAILKVLQLFVF
ncbi:preprotein translocase subunit SecE [Latilactobacillus graminis]|uniref:Preprotein translocase subunit SecE n=1 Tax=Latilactobacillus graminis TaxID=60519 RepID=A0ABX6C9N3_9LACO|nr:preprotein translocase subunit SecE [Latilactobacillus graminis]